MDPKSGDREERRFWVIGWADGKDAQLTAIDFTTGREAYRFTQPLEQIAGHIHPRVQGSRATAYAGVRTPEDLGY